jgi:hypothetical protein
VKLKALLVLIIAATTAYASHQAPAPQKTPPPVYDNALLWRDPGAIESRNLYWGDAAEERQPKPPFQFVQENLKGTTAKVIVTDANAVTWDVKLSGEESHPEVLASRLLWGIGYPTQEMYFVHDGMIPDAKNLTPRAAMYVKPDGFFEAARFRRRDASIDDVGKWSFQDNPFVGTKELSGLILMMALINNWDTELDRNMDVMAVKKADGGIEHWYIVKDLGAAFGSYRGPKGTPIKWHLPSFQKEPWLKGVKGGDLILHYRAYGTPPDRVPVEHARWFLGLMGRVTEHQIRDALKAAGATPAEMDGYAQKILAKVDELRTAVGAPTQASQ